MFNLKGELIVNTPAEAFSTINRSGMDVLVLDLEDNDDCQDEFQKARCPPSWLPK